MGSRGYEHGSFGSITQEAYTTKFDIQVWCTRLLSSSRSLQWLVPYQMCSILVTGLDNTAKFRAVDQREKIFKSSSESSMGEGRHLIFGIRSGDVHSAVAELADKVSSLNASGVF